MFTNIKKWFTPKHEHSPYGDGQRDRAYHELLDAFCRGDNEVIKKALTEIIATAENHELIGYDLDFQLKFMDRFTYPFGAFRTDLLIALWQITSETFKIEEFVQSQNRKFEADNLKGYYPLWVFGHLSNMPVRETDVTYLDAFDTKYEDALYEALDEKKAPSVDFSSVFQDSKHIFPSMSFDVLSLLCTTLQQVNSGQEVFSQIAKSALLFRQEILGGAFNGMYLEQRIGVLGFLLPISPYLFMKKNFGEDAISKEAIQLYEEAKSLII